jgi:GntR family transcriptional repressor for pyruvate dehydrogenase complex
VTTPRFTEAVSDSSLDPFGFQLEGSFRQQVSKAGKTTMTRNKNTLLSFQRTAFRPIKKVDLTLEVVARIKELLANGTLRAGSRLPTERELAQLLHISRPSVRQALKALSFMGLIKARPGTGTYISDSAADILSRPLEFLPLVRNLPIAELFEARALVEVKLAGMAARRATEDDLAAMRKELEACRRHLSDPKKFVHHEIRFHKALYYATGNSVLAHAMDFLYRLLNEFRLRSVAVVEDLEEMLEYHERIYKAIVRRDDVAAIRAMEKHFEYTGAVLKKGGLLAIPGDSPRDGQPKSSVRAAALMNHRQHPES